MLSCSFDRQKNWGWFWTTPIKYRAYELTCFRTFLSLIAWLSLGECKYTSQPNPNGIALFADLTWMCLPSIDVTWRVLYFVACCCYAVKLWTPLSSSYMALFHILFFTLKNSQGFTNHSHQLLSLILLTHACYYCWCFLSRQYGETLLSRFLPQHTVFTGSQRRLSHRRSDGEPKGKSSSKLTDDDLVVFYSQQVMAATYIVAAVTKHLNTSGSWIESSYNVLVQVRKGNDMYFFNWLRYGYEGNPFATMFVEYAISSPLITQLFFGSAFLLELFAFLFLFNRV